MKKYIIIIALVLSVFIEPPKCKPLYSDVVFDGGAITGNALPRYGIVGETVTSHGSPRHDSMVVDTLHAGEKIRLRELSYPGRQWIMIAPAEWIPLEGVCGY